VDANVGTPTAPGLIRSQDYSETTFLNSKYQPVTPHEMALELHNTTSDSVVRLRWMDHHGTSNPLTHQWDVAPSSTFEQFTKPGHLFLISLVTMESQEHVLGAYRTKRALPSLTPHCILVHGEEDEGFLLEMLLLDETKFDALVVAGADLDHHHETSNDRERIERTIQLLQTIVRNVIKYPGEEQYRKLRLSNSQIKRHICDSWGALELLRIVGFVKKSLPSETPACSEDEDYLILPAPTDKTTVCQCALDILDILLSRVQPNFIADIAPPTPWQESVPLGAGNHSRGWNAQRGFITDDEKWARAERVASQRGSARKPEPGEAPSSRGKWGR
jgi:hypothetical protein